MNTQVMEQFSFWNNWNLLMRLWDLHFSNWTIDTNTWCSEELFICGTSAVRVQILQLELYWHDFCSESNYICSLQRDGDTSLWKRNCRHFILDNKTLCEPQLQEALFCQASEFKSAWLLTHLQMVLAQAIQCQVRMSQSCRRAWVFDNGRDVSSRSSGSKVTCESYLNRLFQAVRVNSVLLHAYIESQKPRLEGTPTVIWSNLS